MVSADIFKDEYKSNILLQEEPFEKHLQIQYADRFQCEGWLFLKSLLTKKEVAVLKDAMEKKINDPRINCDSEEDYIRGVGLMRMFEYHQSFRDLIAREPIVSLVEEILGAECHVVAQNALVTSRGNGIVNWHIDDHLYFSFLSEVNQEELRGKVPCNVLTVMFPLTNIETIKHGPTQVIPCSHFSGQRPTTQEDPTFEGQVALSIYAEAGDVYMFNSQVWHRGAQNDSERVRFMVTTTYGRRFVSQRFYPFLNYHMPSHVLEGADQRLLRLLGKHPKGAYG